MPNPYPAVYPEHPNTGLPNHLYPDETSDGIGPVRWTVTNEFTGEEPED